jgi:hypothetical protein
VERRGAVVVERRRISSMERRRSDLGSEEEKENTLPFAHFLFQTFLSFCKFKNTRIVSKTNYAIILN